MPTSNHFGQYLAEVRKDFGYSIYGSPDICGAVGPEIADAQAERQGDVGEQPPDDDDHDWSDYMCVPTPAELNEVYNRGFMGALPDAMKPRTVPSFDFGAIPNFYTLFPWAQGIGKGKICLAYLPVLAYVPTYGTYEPQTRGSCVSHGTRNGGMCDYCADALMGQTTFKGVLCTENIYAWRGHRGCGANCSTLSHCVSKEGRSGFLLRGKYGSVDLTTFSSKTESWGASHSNGSEVDEIAAQNKSLSVFRCATPDEERDAHALGFGTNGCSGLGFRNSTDDFGLSEQSGSWAHSMARAGTVDTPWAHQKYGGSIRCTIQSWGEWNRINGKPEGVPASPGGSFWTREKLFPRYDIYGYADVVGYERAYGDVADYLTERAKVIQEFTQKCYDEKSISIAP